MTKVHGHSLAEAAMITGTTPGAIKLRAHRAYVTLRARLGDNEAAANRRDGERGRHEPDAGPGGDVLSPAEAAPPPGASLLAAMEDMKPVRTRAPRRTLALLALAGAGVVAAVLAVAPWREDLPALPMAWVAAMALSWTLGWGRMLLVATLPRRGEVLPDTARAGRTTLAVTALLFLLGLFATVDAPGRTYMPPDMPRLRRALVALHPLQPDAGLPLLLVGGLLLRRLFPMGGLRVAAALGALGGATAGLALHFTCPVGGGLHVGLAHAGGVAVGALVAMLLLPRLLRADAAAAIAVHDAQPRWPPLEAGRRGGAGRRWPLGRRAQSCPVVHPARRPPAGQPPPQTTAFIELRREQAERRASASSCAGPGARSTASRPTCRRPWCWPRTPASGSTRESTGTPSRRRPSRT